MAMAAWRPISTLHTMASADLLTNRLNWRQGGSAASGQGLRTSATVTTWGTPRRLAS